MATTVFGTVLQTVRRSIRGPRPAVGLAKRGEADRSDLHDREAHGPRAVRRKERQVTVEGSMESTRVTQSVQRRLPFRLKRKSSHALAGRFARTACPAIRRVAIHEVLRRNPCHKPPSM